MPKRILWAVASLVAPAAVHAQTAMPLTLAQAGGPASSGGAAEALAADGSISLDTDISSIGQPDDKAGITSIAPLIERLERDEFDLVAVGRALIADPEWTRKIKEGRLSELTPYRAEQLATLN